MQSGKKREDASYSEEKLYINLECAKFMGMGSKASKGRKKEWEKACSIFVFYLKRYAAL